MLTDLALGLPALVLGGLVALVVLGPLVALHLSERPRLARVIAGAVLLLVVVVTLLPTGLAEFAGCASALTPPGAADAANALLFAPLALALGAALRRPAIAALVVSGVSGAIELTQALLPALGRSCDLGDWISNTVGAVLGGAVAGAGLALSARSSRGRGGRSPV